MPPQEVIAPGAWKSVAGDLRLVLPGLHLVLAVALLSRYLHGLLPGPSLPVALSEVLFAVAIGLYLRSFFGVPRRFEAGVKFALQRILHLGIVLLGLRLSLQDVSATGGPALLLVLVCVAVALVLAYAAGRLFGIPARLALLIGLGTAVCGNSAIVATAPVIEAREEDVSFAVATITLFGLVAVVLFPAIGHLAGLSDRVFGLWAGMSVNDTSQVVAVGAAYSRSALDVATVVKLTRNTLMAPLMAAIGLVYSRSGDRARAASGRLTLGRLVPGFVLGFLALSLLRTAGVAVGWLPANTSQPGDLRLAANVLTAADQVARLAILMALAAVGLSTDWRSLRRVGLKPFVVGLCVAAVLAVLSLGLILLTGAGG